MLGYLRNVWTGFVDWAVSTDQLANTLTGGLPGETLSYRAALARADGSRFACVFCRFLDLFQRDHCTKTFKANDRSKLVMPMVPFDH